MPDPTDESGTQRRGPLGRCAALVRRWLFSGGCRSCKSHEDDIDRWQRELAEQRGETKDARDG